MLDPNHVEAIPWYLCRGTHPIIFSVHSDSFPTPLRLRLRMFVFFCIFFDFFCIFFVFFLYFFCILFLYFFFVFFFGMWHITIS